MPFLDRKTQLRDAEGKNYVWFKGHVYFNDLFDNKTEITHGDLVKRAAQKLGISLSEIERDDRSRPMVEAAGKIEDIGGKFSFGVNTSSCNVIYSANDAVEKVTNYAKDLLGEENVR